MRFRNLLIIAHYAQMCGLDTTKSKVLTFKDIASQEAQQLESRFRMYC